ncbi:MAG: hypothetical protein HC802_05620 [Caldilineaceae bacterium]|nr:hypothetical protein [Caldilineaceae bacterium]
MLDAEQQNPHSGGNQLGGAGYGTATAAEHTLHQDWAILGSLARLLPAWAVLVGVVGCPQPPSR